MERQKGEREMERARENRGRKFKWHRLTLLLLLVLLVSLVLMPHSGLSAYASAEELSKEYLAKGWKETVIEIAEPKYKHSISWCGPQHFLVKHSDDKLKKTYLALYNIETGKKEEFRENPPHWDMACSFDGKYIFYVRPGLPKGKRRSLNAYDVRTKRMSAVYSLEGSLPIYVQTPPLSPSGKYIIWPEDRKEKVRLPGGEEAEPVPLRGIVKSCQVGVHCYGETIWSFDGETLVLHSSGTKIIDMKTKSVKEVVTKIEGTRFTKYILLSPDNNTMYFQAYSDDDELITGVLYSLNLRDISKAPRRITEKMDRYGIAPDGSLIFSRSEIPWGRIIHNVYMLDSTGKTHLIKGFVDVGPLLNRFVVPVVSRQSTAFLFFRKFGDGRNTVTVLTKTDNTKEK
jgi:hypothetical protein